MDSQSCRDELKGNIEIAAEGGCVGQNDSASSDEEAAELYRDSLQSLLSVFSRLQQWIQGAFKNF